MPGSIRVSVLEAVDLPAEATACKYVSVKVSVGKREFQTKPNKTFDSKTPPWNSDFIFPVLNLRDHLVVVLLDSKGDQIAQNEIETPAIVERGFWDEFLTLKGGGRIHLKLSFVLTEEEQKRIEMMRAAALKRREQEALKKNSSSQALQPAAENEKSPVLLQISAESRPEVLRSNEDKENRLSVPVLSSKNLGAALNLEKVGDVSTDKETKIKNVLDLVKGERKGLDMGFEHKMEAESIDFSHTAEQRQNVVVGCPVSCVTREHAVLCQSNENNAMSFLNEDLSSSAPPTYKECDMIEHRMVPEIQHAQSVDLSKGIPSIKQVSERNPTAAMELDETFEVGISNHSCLSTAMSDADVLQSTGAGSSDSVAPLPPLTTGSLPNLSLIASEAIKTQSLNKLDCSPDACFDSSVWHLPASGDGSISPTPLIELPYEPVPPIDLGEDLTMGVSFVKEGLTPSERTPSLSVPLVSFSSSSVMQKIEQGSTPEAVSSEKTEVLFDCPCADTGIKLGEVEEFDSIGRSQLVSSTVTTTTTTTSSSSSLQRKMSASHADFMQQMPSDGVFQTPRMTSRNSPAATQNSEFFSGSTQPSVTATTLVSSDSTARQDGRTIDFAKPLEKSSLGKCLLKTSEETLALSLQKDGQLTHSNSVKARIKAYESTFSQENDQFNSARRSENCKLQLQRSAERLRSEASKKLREQGIRKLVMEEVEKGTVEEQVSSCKLTEQVSKIGEQREGKVKLVRYEAHPDQISEQEGGWTTEVQKEVDSKRSALAGTAENSVEFVIADRRQVEEKITDEKATFSLLEVEEGSITTDAVLQCLGGNKNVNNQVVSKAGEHSASLRKEMSKGHGLSSIGDVVRQFLVGGAVMVAIGVVCVWASAGNKNQRVRMKGNMQQLSRNRKKGYAYQRPSRRK